MSTNNDILEDNIDQLSGSGFRKIINILEASQSKEVSWWINELDSLGIKNSSNNNKNGSNDIHELEDHADEIKQTFIRDYKKCINE
jgi:uncharacterized protein Yka (UPF0111/DUF47 family)